MKRQCVHFIFKFLENNYYKMSIYDDDLCMNMNNNKFSRNKQIQPISNYMPTSYRNKYSYPKYKYIFFNKLLTYQVIFHL